MTATPSFSILSEGDVTPDIAHIRRASKMEVCFRLCFGLFSERPPEIHQRIVLLFILEIIRRDPPRLIHSDAPGRTKEPTQECLALRILLLVAPSEREYDSRRIVIKIHDKLCHGHYLPNLTGKGINTISFFSSSIGNDDDHHTICIP